MRGDPLSAPASLSVVGSASTARRSSPALPTSAITGAEELHCARVVNLPVAAAAGVPSESVSAAQAALRDLQLSCEYASALASPTLAAGLMAANSWLAEARELRAHVAELLAREEQRDTEADRIRDEAMALIRAAEDHLAALGQEVPP